MDHSVRDLNPETQTCNRDAYLVPIHIQTTMLWDQRTLATPFWVHQLDNTLEYVMCQQCFSSVYNGQTGCSLHKT